MKRASIALIALSTVVLLASLRLHARSDGKEVFLAKCKSCHSISTEGIQAGGVATGMKVDWSRQCHECTEDLSGVGQRRKADWLKAYLKNDKKGRNGLRHNQLPVTQDGKLLILDMGGKGVPMAGSLTDDELEAVVQWLATLKAQPAAAAPRPDAVKATEVSSSKNPPVMLPSEEARTALRTAHTVAVVGQTGAQLANRAMWNPDGERGRQKVVNVLSEWGRYTVAERPEEADLVLVVTEFQKNINFMRLANLVAEMRVYKGGQPPSAESPVVWAGDAAEGFSQPATKVAEKFRDFVKALPPQRP